LASAEKKCLFCGKNESISHLFFLCPLAGYIWNVIICTFGLNFQFALHKCVAEGVGEKEKEHVLKGIAVVVWII
jgi:hypothetical protein